MKTIEFIDLKAQQLRIRDSIERRIRTVLDHGVYILGPEVEELEGRLAIAAGVKHCISCANGTDALLMVLMAYGVGPGDAIFVPTFTFMATAEVVSLLGAHPVFVDCDPNTFNMAPEAFKFAVKQTRANQSALRIRGVIPVDLFGLPADYESITAVARENGMFVIEDAAQSFGATNFGKPAGSLAPVATTSFFPAKPLGCYGDGGAIFTSDDSLAVTLRSIRVHGKGADKYDNVRIGLNGRLDTIQAAVLLAKLEIFDEEIRLRGQVAARYSRSLRGSFSTPNLKTGQSSAWAQYSILCYSTADRESLIQKLRERGVPTQIYYPKPLHLQKAFSSLGHVVGDFPVSELTATRILSLPMHPYLSSEDQDWIIQSVNGE